MQLTFTTTVEYNWVFTGSSYYLSEFDDLTMCWVDALAKITWDAAGFHWYIPYNTNLSTSPARGLSPTLATAKQAVHEVLKKSGVRIA